MRGVILFLNAGDPPLDVLEDVILDLDSTGMEWLELAVPFPDSITDGPVIRRSARRALDAGTDADAVLAFVGAIQPRLRRLRIALLADWRHTVRPRGLEAFVADVRACRADGLLVHALVPRVRAEYYETARALGQPIVTTCFPSSPADVRSDAARNATAYLYLASRAGRTGGRGSGFGGLASVVGQLRAQTRAPIAVGFGIRDAHDIAAVRAAGADAAVLGTACVERVERALAQGRDPREAIAALLRDLGR